ncbi:MAG: c-type cytochrome domain-containing protein [Gemmataceae bacterium]
MLRRWLLAGITSAWPPAPLHRAPAGIPVCTRCAADPFRELLRLPRTATNQAARPELRLDTPEGAAMKLRSGAMAVVPGKPDESELIVRILSERR